MIAGQIKPVDTGLRDSRFIQITDPGCDSLVFELPDYWWSRPYEYAWAMSLARPGMSVLDAASGICHPLKFALHDLGCHVKVCDLDERITSPEAIKAETLEVFGKDEAGRLKPSHLADIDYRRASLTQLPYEDRSFDAIFCISVLEHLPDAFNSNYRRLRSFKRLLQPVLRHDISKTLLEFRRVLKDDGQVALTFDHPRINLDYLVRAVADSGLKFAAQVSLQTPENALYSHQHRLRCFRALLEKRL